MIFFTKKRIALNAKTKTSKLVWMNPFKSCECQKTKGRKLMNCLDVFDTESQTEKLLNSMRLMSRDYFASTNNYIPKSNILETTITIYFWFMTISNLDYFIFVR